jgi:hypothetical protein
MKNYYYKNLIELKEKEKLKKKAQFNILFLSKTMFLFGSLPTILGTYNISTINFLKRINDNLNMFIDDIPVYLKVIFYEGGKFDFSIFGISFSFLLKSCYFFKHKIFIKKFYKLYNKDYNFKDYYIKNKVKRNYLNNIIKASHLNYYNTFNEKVYLKTFINIYDIFICYKLLIDFDYDNNLLELKYNKINFFKIMFNNIKRLNFIPDIRKSINLIIYFLKNIKLLKNKYKNYLQFIINYFKIYEESI